MKPYDLFNFLLGLVVGSGIIFLVGSFIALNVTWVVGTGSDAEFGRFMMSLVGIAIGLAAVSIGRGDK